MTHLAQILETAAGVAAVSAGTVSYAVRVPSCAWLAPSVYRGVDTRPAIALTFDDGPSDSTGRLLEILGRHRVPATFFQCGAHVRRLPAVAREVLAAGHQIGNHSDTHPLLALKSPAIIQRELATAQDSIEDVTGVRPTYFRAPYGVRWFGLRSAQSRLGLLGVLWTTIARDWTLASPAIVSRLLHGATPGAILCLHDGRGIRRNPDITATLQAVRELLPQLIDRGYHFEKVSDILSPGLNPQGSSTLSR